MDIFWGIYEFLWEFQWLVVFVLVLIVWLPLRGFDFFRWCWRKIKGKGKSVSESGSPKSKKDS